MFKSLIKRKLKEFLTDDVEKTATHMENFNQRFTNEREELKQRQKVIRERLNNVQKESNSQFN